MTSGTQSTLRVTAPNLLVLCATFITGACARAPMPVHADPALASACRATEAPLVALAGLPVIDTSLIRTHTRVLAHDSLEGRGTASRGARGAARYIARQLEALGARPLPPASPSPSAYLLPVPLLRSDVADATLTLTTASGTTRLRHGAGFIAGRMGRDGMHAASGGVARVSADSADVIAGSWVVLDAPLGEAAVRWIPAWKRAGVTGVVVRLGSDDVVSSYHQQLGDFRWHLREGAPDPVWQPDLPVVMVAPGVADALVAGASRVEFDPRARVDTLVDYNVAGVFFDHDASTARTLVALTAHYDHLGIVRGAASGDSIFNGFSDNAAGVAMLLAIAASAAQAPPAHALLLLFTAAEETGLLGSLHFVRAYPEVVGRLHALVNLDAGAPPAPPTRWRLAAGTRSWAGEVAAAVVESHGWTHRADPGSPNSDHWPFVARGVPSVFLIPDGAYQGVDEAGEQRLRARWDRYHRLDDEWSADFPFAGLGRYALLARDIVWGLASAAAPCP